MFHVLFSHQLNSNAHLWYTEAPIRLAKERTIFSSELSLCYYGTEKIICKFQFNAVKLIVFRWQCLLVIVIFRVCSWQFLSISLIHTTDNKNHCYSCWNRIGNVMVTAFISSALNANSAIFRAISWREQVNLQWYDDEVRFVLDQHVAPLGPIILIPSKRTFALSP
jgi:hypothetical protein